MHSRLAVFFISLLNYVFPSGKLLLHCRFLYFDAVKGFLKNSTVLFLLVTTLSLSSCTTAWRSIVYNLPNITDYKIFPYKTVGVAPTPYPINEAAKKELPPVESWALGKKSHHLESMEEFFKKTGTVALLELEGDSLHFEYYAEGFDKESIFTTFSLAKVFVSTLVGIAIGEGHIESVDQPVADFLPQFRRDSALQTLTLRHLLQMTSGLQKIEGIAKVARLYYGKRLDKETQRVKIKEDPGSKFLYANFNTQILSLVLKEATGRSVAEYLEEKVWIPAGMEAPATWSLDREGGMEKAFCCINARARDYLRFGMIFLDQGRLNGKQIVPIDWVLQATDVDTIGGSLKGYQYHWFTSAEHVDFFGQGLVGQFLYVAPETGTVILRLGKKIEFTPWYDIFKILGHLSYKPEKIPLTKEELKPFEGEYVFYNSLSGDTSLIGKAVRITAKDDHLKVNPEFKSAFNMDPASETLFFNQKDSRKIHFHFDENGNIISLDWTRRGNVWELVPSQE